MRAIVFSLALLLLAGAAVASDTTMPVSVNPVVGAYVPTGDQSKELKRAVLTGIEMGYDLAAPLRLVGTVAWAPSRDKSPLDQRLNVYQYDAGVELTPRRTQSERWQVRPFVGAGLGGES